MGNLKFHKIQPSLRPKNLNPESEETSATSICYGFIVHRRYRWGLKLKISNLFSNCDKILPDREVLLYEPLLLYILSYLNFQNVYQVTILCNELLFTSIGKHSIWRGRGRKHC